MNDKNLYYKDKKGKIIYNKLCVDCPYSCKQSFRSMIITCKLTKEQRKNRKGK